MNLPKAIEDAFTGLEAAIVLIAFIIVAAVFGYVVLGAGFLTTEKAQESVHAGIQQTTSAVQPSGELSIQSDGAGTGINTITFYLQLAAGGTGVDMGTFSYTITTPAKVGTFSSNDVTYTWVKESTGTNHGDHTGVMNLGEMVLVTIHPGFSSSEMGARTKFLVEVKPSVGAAVPISGTVPMGMNANTWYSVY